MGEKKDEKKGKITPVDWGTGDGKLVATGMASRPIKPKGTKQK